MIPQKVNRISAPVSAFIEPQMKLFALFLSVAFLCVLLQSTVLHLLPLGPVVPDLALVLCVYWALNRPSVGTVLGAFLMGYTVDVFSSPILGVNTFAMSLVFLSVHLSSRHIWVRSPLFTMTLVFLASLVKVTAIVILWSIFLATQNMWAAALKYIFLEALSAALLSPVVFFLLSWAENRLEPVRNVP